MALLAKENGRYYIQVGRKSCSQSFSNILQPGCLLVHYCNPFLVFLFGTTYCHNFKQYKTLNQLHQPICYQTNCKIKFYVFDWILDPNKVLCFWLNTWSNHVRSCSETDNNFGGAMIGHNWNISHSESSLRFCKRKLCFSFSPGPWQTRSTVYATLSLQLSVYSLWLTLHEGCIFLILAALLLQGLHDPIDSNVG